MLDQELDAIYPAALRLISSSLWTPVSVALRAAEMLARGPASRILDIGAGVGKFCIVGASATDASFVGVEHRGHFVEVAREAARRMGVTRVELVHGSLEGLDVAAYDGIYLFNPFEENVWNVGDHLDGSVELSGTRFDADVARTRALLEGAEAGTRVATYHGFGGEMPESYRLVSREWRRSGYLDLWVKGRPRLKGSRASPGDAS